LDFIRHVDVAPLQFWFGEGHAVLGDVFHLAFAFDVAGGLLSVVAEGGALVPILMRFEEIFIVADEFAIGTV
jgi:hypothetical protein